MSPNTPAPGELLRASRRVVIPLGMPIIVAVGIFGGFFTPTEAAAVASAYALIATMVILRTLKPVDLGPILLTTAKTTAAIAILTGVAAMFSYVIARRNIPEQALQLLLTITDSTAVVVLLIILLLLIAGMIVDRTSNILLLGPILVPLFGSLGYSDVHAAMIIIISLGVGHLAPPVGGTLLTTALVGRVSMLAITRYIWPFILVEILIALIDWLVPWFSEALPRYRGLGGL